MTPPRRSQARPAAQLAALAHAHDGTPAFRCTAAMSDGTRLIVLRASSDGQSPTLYHRWDDRLQGRAVVSEPLEKGEGWEAIPEGTLTVFGGREVAQAPFPPLAAAA